MASIKEGHRTYVLKGNKTPVSWQLRQKDVIVEYKNRGMVKLKYVAGHGSILEVDNRDFTTTPIYFENGVLHVPLADKKKIEYIELHPDFNSKFLIHDPEVDAKNELDRIELIEKAKDFVRNADNDLLKATAVMLFDTKAFNFGEREVTLKCYAYAEKNPRELLDILKDPKTPIKYLVAVAINKQIIKTNIQHSAIVWVYNNEMIFPLAKGEMVIEKAAEELSKDENVITLQEIGKRIEEFESLTTA